MKRISLAFLLLFSTIYAVKAQKNYKPALIIKAAGDTVKGYINYKEWEENPKSIEFKSTVTAIKTDRYTADMLRSFEVLGMDKYFSYVGNISADKNKFPDVADALDTTKIRDTVFLQQIYKGQHLSLLKHTDKIKTRFFIIEQNIEPVELKYYQYYITNLEVKQLKIFQDYLSKLAQKYNAPKSIEARISKAEFTESDLFAITKSINQDKATKSLGTGGSRFYAGILFNKTITDFVGVNPLDGQKAYSYIPTLNTGVDIFTNKYTQRFFFRVDLSLSANTPHFKYQAPANYLISYQFKQYTASLTPQLIYNFYNKDYLKIYLGIGAGLNYSVYGNNEYKMSNTSIADRYSLNNAWVSPVFKAGAFVGKKVEIYAQYTPPTNNTNYVYFSIRNSSYGLGLHYLLVK